MNRNKSRGVAFQTKSAKQQHQRINRWQAAFNTHILLQPHPSTRPGSAGMRGTKQELEEQSRDEKSKAGM
jgi:hypothetical protein